MNTSASESSSPTQQDLLEMTAEVAAAYVSNNVVPSDELPDLISRIHQALATAGTAEEEPEPEKLKPAVSVRRSITPDHLVCLEDGKKLKMLKRYLRTNFDMSPEEYRAKWNLPADYPMVAPNYAKKRAEMAKAIGLGRGGRRRKGG
ncbi:MAG: MucR family transcriptional regulator [Minwuia sp.]|uniref:MucR family transcriptional regulator n=1 Tax=Minwuia sp. TaxID=2493630 RepID=UPI003A8A454D